MPKWSPHRQRRPRSSQVTLAEHWNPATFSCPPLSAGTEPKSQGHCQKWHHKLCWLSLKSLAVIRLMHKYCVHKHHYFLWSDVHCLLCTGNNTWILFHHIPISQCNISAIILLYNAEMNENENKMNSREEHAGKDSASCSSCHNSLGSCHTSRSLLGYIGIYIYWHYCSNGPNYKCNTV